MAYFDVNISEAREKVLNFIAALNYESACTVTEIWNCIWLTEDSCFLSYSESLVIHIWYNVDIKNTTVI